MPQTEPREIPVIHTQIERSKDTILQSLAPALHDAFAQLLAVGATTVAKLARYQKEGVPTDNVLDNAWGGLDDQLRGRARSLHGAHTLALSNDEKTDLELATAARAALIGPDLKFSTLAYYDQWRESHLRLLRLDTPLAKGASVTLRQAIEALGYAKSLDRLERAHRLFGAVLGVSAEGGVDLSADVEAFNTTLTHLLDGLAFFHRAARSDTSHPLYIQLIAPIEAAWQRQRDRRKGSTRPTSDGAEPTIDAPV